MGRLLVVFILLAVSLYIVKYLRIKLNNVKNYINKESEEGSDKNMKKSQRLMVKCQHCGLHIPEKEAIKQGDNIFCSLEHAKKEL